VARPPSPARRPPVPRPSSVELTSTARWTLIGSGLVTLAVFVTPGLRVIAIPLLYLSTLVHEMGHGVGALLSGGRWDEFRMFADGSGYASAWGEGGFGTALTCAAGLVGPAVAAAVFMAVGLRARLARWALGATGGFFALSLLLWVRGGFGLAFVTLVAAACVAVAVWAGDEVARAVLLFLATQLALSVYSRGGYLFQHHVAGQMSGGERTPSDVQIMADAIGMPYWFWGIACAGFSAAVLALAVWLYLPRRRGGAPAR